MSNMQLPLPVTLPDHAVFASFFAGPNQAACDYLESQEQQGVCWLWGPAASGKTHLLQAACAARNESEARSAYLPLGDFESMSPAMLAGYEHFDLVALDDLDSVLGNPDWEHALFVLFNRLVSEQGNSLLVASCTAPQGSIFSLPDLRSRLLSGPVYALESLEDDDLVAALQLRAHRRGLDLPESTARYVLSHMRRDMHSLQALLEKLDHVSLVRKQRLTIPLVKVALGDAVEL